MRANLEHFSHPNPNVHKLQKPLPDSLFFLEYFQDVVTVSWQQYCIGNLADLRIEFVRKELVSKIIPNAFETSNNIMSAREEEEQEQYDGNNEDHYKETNGNNKHRLQSMKCNSLLAFNIVESPISISIIWCWLSCRGLSHDSRRKIC
jgi:hypothetical protein